MIDINIDQKIDVMKLEKSNRTLQKKEVTYDEENCENLLILYGNLLVLTLTWKQM